MKVSFWTHCKWIALVHVVLVVVILAGSLIARLFSGPDEVLLPIEFVVDVTSPAEAMQVPDPEPVAIPEPPPPTEDVIPEEPAPVKRRPEIVPVRKRVTRTVGEAPRAPTLSPEEIQKLLAMGAKPSDHTSVPDEDQRCMASVRNALNAVWEQPEKEAAAGREAILEIRLDAGGRILSGTLKRPSGSSELDASVRDILSRVNVVPGITPGFVKRYPSIEISFVVR